MSFLSVLLYHVHDYLSLALKIVSSLTVIKYRTSFLKTCLHDHLRSEYLHSAKMEVTNAYYPSITNTCSAVH